MPSRDRLYRVQAIILKRSDFGEADRLLTLYTPDLGKIRAIAKGARKPSSRKSGHVELFTHSVLLLAKGMHLDIVTQAETVDAFMPLRTNLERLGYAYYLAELVDKFAEEGTENKPLFDLLLHALGWLSDGTNDPVLVARFFELQLLHLVGYRPQLYHCVNCGAELEPVENYFSAEAGGIIEPNCMRLARSELAGHGRDARPISLNALKVLRFMQTREFETIRPLRLSPQVLAEIESLMSQYISHHLERSLKSVDFLHQLKQPFAALPQAEK
ncbi:MAG: DNA repair protein RecO [Chloroflexi bacterium]|nr:DNA repair protein RecO [Chloroflexota bacterium]MCL5950440.1 DNA repair protein RecO [Chloroflexota bacterium]